MKSKEYIEGYEQALEDLIELNSKGGAKYQQYYRNITKRNAELLKEKNLVTN